MKRKTSGERSAGFTLLEVMLSVAVLAVGVVPLLVTHASTVANIRRAREMTFASLLSRERLAELEVYGFTALAETGLADLPGSGAEDGVHPFLKFEEAVEETETDAEMLSARVKASRRDRPPGEGDDPAGAAPATYIVNLYFEPEEDLILED